MDSRLVIAALLVLLLLPAGCAVWDFKDKPSDFEESVHPAPILSLCDCPRVPLPQGYSGVPQLPAQAFETYMQLPVAFRKKIERDLINYSKLIRNINVNNAFLDDGCPAANGQ
jgi:hypothetical protein